MEIVPLLDFENLTDLRVQLRPAGGAAKAEMLLIFGGTAIGLIIISSILMLLL